MLKTILAPLVLPLLLFLSSGSDKPAANLKQPSNVSNNTPTTSKPSSPAIQEIHTGTLEKMMVAEGTAAMEFDLARLNGDNPSAKTNSVNFSVVPNSFFTILVFNKVLRGPEPGSMALIPHSSADVPAALSASLNQLVIEKTGWSEQFDLVVRDAKTGFTYFNIEGNLYDYNSKKLALSINEGRLLISKEFAELLGRPDEAGAFAGTISVTATMRTIEITQMVDGEVTSSIMPALGALVPGPDVIVGDMPALQQFGSSGTQVGLAVATDSCNAGAVPLRWFALPNNDHPVIPQNLYRLSGGPNNDERLEQIGQSWLKHAFTALQQNICGFGCQSSGTGTLLGAGCSDPYSASLNASQSSLGSRAWVNPFTGAFPGSNPSPNSHTGHTHVGTSHRIVVEQSDLNPALNPGATYFAEAQYVTPHEYAWCQANPGQCNQYNNASHRRFNVSGTTSFTFSPVGSTVQTKPAVAAWPGAALVPMEPAPGSDGIASVSYKVTNTGPGVWHYEYLVYNQNLDRAIQLFSVPIGAGATISNIGFRAPSQPAPFANDGTVSSAGYSSAPWIATQSANALTWTTETFAQNPNANAIRWGTAYNFRFDSNQPPQVGGGTVGFFKTGSPLGIQIQGPAAGGPTPTPTPTPTPSPSPSPGINVALAANGGVATASSTFSTAYAVTGVNNGERSGAGWAGGNGGWNDATEAAYPDFVEVAFNGSQTINEIDVFTIQDNFGSPSPPTELMTFSLYGITAFDVQYWTGSAWATVPGGAIVGNNKVWRKVTFPDVTTTKIRVLVNNSLANYSRITEIEAYTPSGAPTPTPTPTPSPSPTPSGTNVALAANGGIASASSTFSAAYAVSGVNNGDRSGAGWGGGSGGWNDATDSAYPDWVEIAFSGSQTINEIDVFTVQDNFGSPSNPTEGMTFSLYGITGFDVQYWTGSAWINVPNGSIVGNNLVWRKILFSDISTTKIRVSVNNSLAFYSRITEIEAYTSDGSPSPTPTPSPSPTPTIGVNVALASNGGVPTASSTFSAAYAVTGINNGERSGSGWAGGGGGWNDATQNAYPDSVEIAFNGPHTINEIDVFTLQDNFSSPSPPTESMTFSLYGITDFDVHYWNGAQWALVPGGQITGNNLVWRKLTFSALTTTKIRVLVNNSLGGFSRITEVEAYTDASPPPEPTPLPTPGSGVLPPGFSSSTVGSPIANPTAMAFAPDGRIFVCQQTGELRVIKNGALLATPFVSLTVNSFGERGLLGVAFDPNFVVNQYVYVYYTATTPTIHNRVSRFTATGDVGGSELPLLNLNNLSATNHNGGAIHFGPDGKLYIAVGENAVPSNSQTLTNLLGKILRINSDGTIPGDNPFVGSATGDNQAIWALGLRNPYTFAFHPWQGRMLINDVGQVTWEEINDGIVGSNYGWNICEGSCGNPSFRDPLFQYAHGAGATTGCAITGGTFYNPPVTPYPAEYLGKFFYADFCSGWIRQFDPGTSTSTAFANSLSSPVDLQVGPDGNLYYLVRGGGGLVVKVAYTG